MPKVKGPLFSISASGTIGKAITFKRGVEGQRVELVPRPRNVKSPAQLAERQLFKEGVNIWLAFSTATKSYYDSLGNKLRMSGYNYFLRLWLLGRYLPSPPLVQGGYGFGAYGEAAYGS